jgi:hypothetical protein
VLYGMEYSGSTVTSTSAARVGVPDYMSWFSLLISILRGRYWC